MRVCVYARVSTDDKDQDPERQLIKCRQYAELHNHVIIKEITEYISGDTDPMQRPECSKAFDQEGIIVYSMDRLTRQHPVKVINLIKALKDQGIKVVSVTEPAFNMEHELSEVMLFLIGWFNNYFLVKLKRDIKSGMDRARLAGKHIGRPKTSFNVFRYVELRENQKLSLDKVAAELGVSKYKLWCFEKEYKQNPDLFINNPGGLKPDD